MPEPQDWLKIEKGKLARNATEIFAQTLDDVQAQVDAQVERAVSGGTLSGDLALWACAQRSALLAIHRKLETIAKEGEGTAQKIAPEMQLKT